MTLADRAPSRWAGDRRWFVIIGGQRARSSLVHRAVAEHPEAFLPHREIAFFEDPNYGIDGCDVFLGHFRSADPDSALGFKRPEIMARPEAPARLHHAMPDARLVALLREPVARTVSAYFHYLRSAFIPMRPLNDGLRALLRGEVDPRYPHSLEVLDFSEYAAGLDRVLEVFPREQLVVLLDRDLDHDPDGSVRAILRHIGVDDSVPLDLTSRVVNAGDYADGIAMHTLRAASRTVYRPAPGSGLARVRPTWPRVVVHGALTRLGRRIPSGSVETALEPDVRAALVERFEPDVRRLEVLIGRELPDWPAR